MVGLSNALLNALLLADPTILAPFVAYTLISLDKNSGANLVYIGDSPQRIFTQAILYCVSDDSIETAGPL